jgi:hypothetical protein
MSNTVTDVERIENPGAQQLTLLTVSESGNIELKPSSAHARFRLSRTTRERGLAHVAEIRRQLAESQAQREASRHTALPPRSNRAA